jgi:hypothetical protein
VATIVAVFMALGVGMVIGSSYLQEAIVDRLRLQLTQLNERFTNEIQPLRKANESQSRAITALTTLAIRNTLDKRRVAIVVTGDYAEVAPRIGDTLKSAGATVASITRVSASLPFRLETNLDALLADLRRWRPSLPDGSQGIYMSIATVIARGSSAGEVRALASTRLVETQGDYRRSVDAVVLLGGGKDETDRRWETVDNPIIEAMSDFGIAIIGAEPESAVQSYIPAYQAKSLSTVDNVDSDIGRTALVLLVAGARGSYGVKSTARDGILPIGVTEP